MKNKSKIELIALAIIVIFYFLLVKNNFSTIIYLLFIIPTAIYFFPIKVFMEKEVENKSILIGSTFIISTSIMLSYVSYILNELNNGFKSFLLIILLCNLFFIYKFFSKNDDKKYMHILITFLILLTIYKG